MTNATLTKPPAKSEASDASPLDLEILRSHARQLEQDLDDIKREIASLKTRYIPETDAESGE